MKQVIGVFLITLGGGLALVFLLSTLSCTILLDACFCVFGGAIGAAITCAGIQIIDF